MMKNSGEKEACEVAKNLAALGGCVKNDTSALGVYSSREHKQTRVDLEFASVATNALDLAAEESE